VSLSIGAMLIFIGFSAILTGLFHSYQLYNWAMIVAALAVSLLFVDLQKEEVKLIALGIFWGSFVNALYALLQTQGIDYIFTRVKGQDFIPVGFSGQQTIFGPWCVVGMMAAIYLRRYWALLLFIPIIILCGSSFTFLSLFAGLAFWIIFGMGIQGAAFVLIPAIIAALFLTQLSPELLNPQGRFELWQNVITQGMKSPFFGRGIGTYPIYAGALQTEASAKMNGVFMQAHSDIIQFFFECGIVGLCLLAWVFFDFLKALFRFWFIPEVALFASIVFVLAVNSLGSFPMRLAPHGVLALCSLVAVVSFRKGALNDR
jgi:O-antigen ligase